MGSDGLPVWFQLAIALVGLVALVWLVAGPRR